MRYIIECEDTDDIILGMKCIRTAIKENLDVAFLGFDDNDLWFVRKTKTGYSARKSK